MNKYTLCLVWVGVVRGQEEKELVAARFEADSVEVQNLGNLLNSVALIPGLKLRLKDGW